jgi:hypothetical protein
MFINFDVNAGLSINSFRKPGASVGDVGDLVAAVESGDECVSCDLDGAADALCDGSYLQGLSVSQDAVEQVYNFIQENK